MKLKIKQYFCKHDFEYLTKHKTSSQNLWQCKKCLAYYIQHWGIGLGYKCKKPNITGWKEPIRESPTPPNVKSEPSQSVNPVISIRKSIEASIKAKEPTPDMVNHPSHYNEYPLENLETIKGSMSLIEYQGFLKGSALKYLYRYRLKGKPEEDLRKAQFYQNELIKTLEGETK